MLCLKSYNVFLKVISLLHLKIEQMKGGFLSPQGITYCSTILKIRFEKRTDLSVCFLVDIIWIHF